MCANLADLPEFQRVIGTYLGDDNFDKPKLLAPLLESQLDLERVRKV